MFEKSELINKTLKRCESFRIEAEELSKQPRENKIRLVAITKELVAMAKELKKDYKIVIVNNEPKKFHCFTVTPKMNDRLSFAISSCETLYDEIVGYFFDKIPIKIEGKLIDRKEAYCAREETCKY